VELHWRHRGLQGHYTAGCRAGDVSKVRVSGRTVGDIPVGVGMHSPTTTTACCGEEKGWDDTGGGGLRVDGAAADDAAGNIIKLSTGT
jgi:hypothetical protein